jgi:hypothetical protein
MTVTVPVGVPPVPVTVAVKVTGIVTATVVALAVSCTVVSAWTTLKFSGGDEVLEPSLASPRYLAVRE